MHADPDRQATAPAIEPSEATVRDVTVNFATPIPL